MASIPPPISRRGLLAGAAATTLIGAGNAHSFPSHRPPPSARTFVSPAVEAALVRVTQLIADPELAWMFVNCWPNTLDTTVEMGAVDGAPDGFVITGDIPAMWLRDSAAQVHAYLPYAAGDPALRTLFRGVIARHARSILIDPYANAFMRDPAQRTTLSWAQDDQTDMKPGVAERKWELDGLCHVTRLGHEYWRRTRDPHPFGPLWGEAARAIVRTMREQQRKDGPGPYHFQRAAESATDTQILSGFGAPTRKVGLIHSMFRPSDDATVLPFLVPANLFAVTALRQIAAVASEARGDPVLATDARTLADEVEAAVRAHGLTRGPQGEACWAYEVDGFGNAIFMDDANAPSLSSLAYLGCAAADDPLFRRTEALCWSDANPYFFRGRAAEGIGGPHIGTNQIWPMSLLIRALSSSDPQVIRGVLRTLKATHAGTGFMHESFDADDPARFTRPWFAWANGLFGELILRLARERPALLAERL